MRETNHWEIFTCLGGSSDTREGEELETATVACARIEAKGYISWQYFMHVAFAWMVLAALGFLFVAWCIVQGPCLEADVVNWSLIYWFWPGGIERKWGGSSFMGFN